MTQLPIKQFIFKSCHMTENVAQIFVDSLKGDHSFCNIELFERKEDRWITLWNNYSGRRWDYTWSWKYKITREVDFLKWSNQFWDDRHKFLQEIFGAGSINEKLNKNKWKTGVKGLYTLHCSDSEKFCYAAMLAATGYDNPYKLTSNGCPPSMLYSLIRENPGMLNAFL